MGLVCLCVCHFITKFYDWSVIAIARLYKSTGTGRIPEWNWCKWWGRHRTPKRVMGKWYASTKKGEDQATGPTLWWGRAGAQRWWNGVRQVHRYEGVLAFKSGETPLLAKVKIALRDRSTEFSWGLLRSFYLSLLPLHDLGLSFSSQLFLQSIHSRLSDHPILPLHIPNMPLPLFCIKTKIVWTFGVIISTRSAISLASSANWRALKGTRTHTIIRMLSVMAPRPSWIAASSETAMH